MPLIGKNLQTAIVQKSEIVYPAARLDDSGCAEGCFVASLFASLAVQVSRMFRSYCDCGCAVFSNCPMRAGAGCASRCRYMFAYLSAEWTINVCGDFVSA